MPIGRVFSVNVREVEPGRRPNGLRVGRMLYGAELTTEGRG